MATLEELKTDLQLVNDAYKRLLSGESVTQLIVGTGVTKRQYTFAEITPALLLAEKKRLEGEIANLQGTEPVFSKHSRMQTTWSKT